MSLKEKILDLLDKTDRQGIDEVMAWLSDNGFFEAPASVNHHGNYEGGLAEHSYNVYTAAMRLRATAVSLNPALDEELPEDSIVLAALLHDVCKTDIYKTATKSRKNSFGTWDKYEGYEIDYSHFPLGHGEKSVIVLLRLGLDLTDAEIAAIRWHMTAWDLPFQSLDATKNLNVARDKYPLCALISLADQFASHLMEDIVHP